MSQLNLSISKRIIMVLIIVMVIGTQSVMLCWSFYPYKPLVVTDLEIISPIIPGQPFEYRITGEKLMDMPAVVSRQFINHIVITLPPLISNVEVGTKSVVSSFILPQLPTGTYYYKMSWSYMMNPLRTITITKKTGPFHIGPT